MPDDDYEVVTIGRGSGCGCGHCGPQKKDYEPKSFPTVREEDTVGGERRINKEIKDLFEEMDLGAKYNCQGEFWYLERIIKVLKIMNDIS
jgi:hypothetical protein